MKDQPTIQSVSPLHELEKSNWGLMNIINYRGCLVSKLIGGYSIFGKKCKTPQEVDELINEAGETIKQSIQ